MCVKAKRRWFRFRRITKKTRDTITGFNSYDGGLILKEINSPSRAYHAFASSRFREVDYNYAERLFIKFQSEFYQELQLKDP